MPTKAAVMLIVATGFWGASFVLMKGLGQHQENLVPGASSWFLASACLVARFGLGALLVLIWRRGNLFRFTPAELWQGVGLGFFGGAGMIFQTDGVTYISASTSAFLTQCYCIFIPLWVGLQRRAIPSARLVLACAMVMAGVAVLANIQWRDLRVGRGEVETIISSLFFTGQILWLERPGFAKNQPMTVTLIMFVTVTLLVLPVAWVTGGGPRGLVAVFSSLPALVIIGLLTVACTVITYLLMNRWQRHIPATHAALIYCCEPLFASLFALFLPACLSQLAHINYANEIVGWRLLAGGGLITAANLLVMWLETPSAKPDPLLAAPSPPET